MATVSRALRTDHPAVAFVLRVVILVLTLATAAIHASLGGLLFILNAVGYTVLAALMVLPGPVAPVRWLVRLALLGFVAATIGGWVLFGARFPLAYIDKGIEVVLVGFLVFEVWLIDGGPVEVVRRIAQLLAVLGAAVTGRGRT
jgi:hypothetical protein